MGGSRSSVHVLDELPQPREDVDAENQAESAAPQQARSSVEMIYGVHSPQCRTRAQHGISKSKVYLDGIIRYASFACAGKPSTLDDALSDTRWRQAMYSEIQALHKNGTWHLVPPPGKVSMNRFKMGLQN
jgi:hypothetical protein